MEWEFRLKDTWALSSNSLVLLLAASSLALVYESNNRNDGDGKCECLFYQVCLTKFL